MATQTIKFEEQEVKFITPSESEMKQRFVYTLSKRNPYSSKVFDLKGQPAPQPAYKSYANVPLVSSIIWPGGFVRKTDKEPRPAGRYIIRYYDGCESIFADEQPKDKATLDAMMSGTRDLIFNMGHLEIFGYDVMKRWYLDWCSYNGESPVGVPTGKKIFRPVDEKRATINRGKLLSKIEEALKLAGEAKEKDMLIHAAYLGIPDLESQTMMPREAEMIRIDYKQKAIDDPEGFIQSFSDKSIRIKQWIRDAMSTGKIDWKTKPNYAIWFESGADIEDISGLRTFDGVFDRLTEKALSSDGEEFVSQLKALYN